MMEEKRKFYAIKEIATMLGVSKSLLYAMVNKRKLDAVRIGVRILIPEEALKKLLAA